MQSFISIYRVYPSSLYTTQSHCRLSRVWHIIHFKGVAHFYTCTYTVITYNMLHWKNPTKMAVFIWLSSGEHYWCWLSAHEIPTPSLQLNEREVVLLRSTNTIGCAIWAPRKKTREQAYAACPLLLRKIPRVLYPACTIDSVNHRITDLYDGACHVTCSWKFNISLLHRNGFLSVVQFSALNQHAFYINPRNYWSTHIYHNILTKNEWAELVSSLVA